MDYLRSLKKKDLEELSEAMTSGSPPLLDDHAKLKTMLGHIVRSGYSTALADQAKEISHTINGEEVDNVQLKADVLELIESDEFEQLKERVCSLVDKQNKRVCTIL